MNANYRYRGCCPECYKNLYFDVEAGEPVPHRCREPETTVLTLCWQCSESYLINDAKCPFCHSTNANHNLEAARKEAEKCQPSES